MFPAQFFRDRPVRFLLILMVISILVFSAYPVSAIIGFAAATPYVYWRKPGNGTNYSWLLFPWQNLLYTVKKIWRLVWIIFFFAIAVTLFSFAIMGTDFRVFAGAIALIFIATEMARFVFRLFLRAYGVKKWLTTNLF